MACKCKDCPVSAATSSVVLNPPLTFVIDTTRSVKPDKDSIFNLTQRVVDRIQETNTNIPSYLLVTFNDFGPDITRNVEIREPTNDVSRFRQEILGKKVTKMTCNLCSPFWKNKNLTKKFRN